MNILDQLIGSLSKLPGIGGKSASRIAYYLLGSDQNFNQGLAVQIADLKKRIRTCSQCGNYTETDLSDARDLYGVSKYLGEVHYPDSITLRTSIIGHALNSSKGLIDWFLGQQGQCRGFTRALFTGLPTVVLAQIVRDVIIPDSGLHGLYHVAADPIAKFDLLELVAEVYGKSIEIIPDDSLQIDRSLNAGRFRAATGYVVPEWPELVRVMHSYYSKVVN